MNKTYYVGQVPRESIIFSVKDERSQPRDLSAYTTATVLFAGPDGLPRVNNGTVNIHNSSGGQLTFTFGTTSVFDVPGDYKVQLKLTGSGKSDFTDITTIKVAQSLEV